MYVMFLISTKLSCAKFSLRLLPWLRRRPPLHPYRLHYRYCCISDLVHCYFSFSSAPSRRGQSSPSAGLKIISGNCMRLVDLRQRIAAQLDTVIAAGHTGKMAMYFQCIFNVFSMYFQCIFQCIFNVFVENMYYQCIINVFSMYFVFWTLLFYQYIENT